MSKLAKVLDKAIRQYRAGDLADAEQSCRQVLRANPANADALHLLGVICYQGGRAEEGIDAISRAIRVSPGNALYHNNLGNALLRANRVEEALTAYEKALALEPRFSDARVNLANVLYQDRKDWNSSAEHYSKVLKADPANIDALIGLGNVMHSSGQVADAVSHYEAALEKRPDEPRLLHNLGLAYHDCRNHAKAIACFEAVHRVLPDDAQALAMWGRSLSATGHHEEAVGKYEAAIERQPNLAAVRFNLGNVYRKLDRYDEAEASYREAVRLDPGYYSAWINLAQVCHLNGRHEQAMEAYQQAFSLNPSYGLCLEKGLLLPVIYGSEQEVMEHRTRYMTCLSALLQEPFLLRDPRNELKTAVNFYLAYQGENDRDAQEALGHLIATGLKSSGFDYPYQPPASFHDKPRIGFISRHFRPGHTIFKLTEGLIENLPREAFDVFVFHIDHPEAPAEVETEEGRMVLLPEQDLRLAQKMIARHELDVLVYADIGMDPGSCLLAQSRLARVQCVLWGHPVTTGIGNIDYFLSSVLIEPENADAHYTETLVLFDTLPACYRAPAVPPGQPLKTDFGFAETDHLYLCPQSIFKLHPAFDALLGEILRRDANGRIVLIRDKSGYCNQLLMERFQRTMGDVADRVIMVDRLKPEQFIKLLAVADVMLDPIGFGGGNTTYEALALGTPIVTLPGEFMRGRVTLGCYLQMDVTDCVATTPDAYVDLAVRLGTDDAFRRAVREKILAQSHRLYDDQGIVTAVAAFFRQVLQAETCRENTHV